MKSNSANPGGDYKLVLKSRGGDAEGPLQTTYRKVKYIYVEPTPALTKMKEGTRTDNLVGFGDTAKVLTGVIPGGFNKASGDTLTLEGCPDDTGAYTATMALTDEVTASDETTITFGSGFTNTSAKPDSEWNGKTARVTFTRNGTAYPLTVNWQNA